MLYFCDRGNSAQENHKIHNIMRKEKIADLNLTPLAQEWFVLRFGDFVNDDEKMRAHISFDVKAFTRFVINHVYEYQYDRQWGEVTIHTAKIVGYDDRSIRKFRKRNL